MNEIISENPNPAPPVIQPNPHFNDHSILLIITLLTSLIAVVEAFTNYKQIGKQSKQLAGLAEKALAVAEPFVPNLRRATWDNSLRAILRAWSKSVPVYSEKLEELKVTTDDVADHLQTVYPELMAELIELPPAKARQVLDAAAEETSIALHAAAEPVDPTTTPEMIASRKRLEFLLTQLHPRKRKDPQ